MNCKFCKGDGEIVAKCNQCEDGFNPEGICKRCDGDGNIQMGCPDCTGTGKESEVKL